VRFLSSTVQHIAWTMNADAAEGEASRQLH
jgi:hypothetical protein